MKDIDRHPPADLRCQIYAGPRSSKCVNGGTHWVKWGGCDCRGVHSDICESDFYSWECDDHFFGEAS